MNFITVPAVSDVIWTNAIKKCKSKYQRTSSSTMHSCKMNKTVTYQKKLLASKNLNNFHELLQILNQCNSCIVHTVSNRNQSLNDQSIFWRSGRSLGYAFTLPEPLTGSSSQLQNRHRERLLLPL